VVTVEDVGGALSRPTFRGGVSALAAQETARDATVAMQASTTTMRNGNFFQITP